MEFPKLRALEAFPVDISGQRMIGLRDPMNLTEGVLAVPQQFYPILCLFDGHHSIVDIQAQYMRDFGELIYRETIEDIINKLDSGLFLDNENFQRTREEIENQFKRSPVRPAYLAGRSYDDSPEKLSAQIEQFFTSPEGPGLAENTKPAGSLKAIIAPHIDFLRGGPCFAWAYKELAEHTDADVFLIFGTAHLPTSQPFVATYKDFETPFGTLPCNRDIVEGIASRVGYDLFQDEFVHRGEHSIEFQTIFLSYLFRDRRDISIVPMLCGSFQEMIASRTQPTDVLAIREFVSAVREAVAEYGHNVCCIAGADLAHVGPRFGDMHPISDGFLKLLQNDDLRMLERLEKVDADGFFANIEADRDRRKICGLPPIYTMLKVTRANSARLLKYEQWPDPNGTVTFASLAFY